MIQNQLPDSNAAAVASVVSDNRQSRKLFLIFDYFHFSIFVKLLYESYLPLSVLLKKLYLKHLVKSRLSSDTATFQVKGIFGVYLEYYLGVYYYKRKIQALNTGLLFVL